METVETAKRIEKNDVYRMSMDKREELFGVPMIWNLRMGDISLGEDQNKITYHQNGADLVLATLDSNIQSMDFSRVPKTLCVGLEYSHVGIFELDLGDDLDLILVEEGAK